MVVCVWTKSQESLFCTAQTRDILSKEHVHSSSSTMNNIDHVLLRDFDLSDILTLYLFHSVRYC